MRIAKLLRGLLWARERRAEDQDGSTGEVPTQPNRAHRDPVLGWSAIGCSVIGTYHEEASRPCEDVSKIMELDRGLVLAVADGAGSARRALVGANLALNAACETAISRLERGDAPVDEEGWNQLLIECVQSGRRAIEGCSGPLHELASTLLMVVLHDETLAAVQVGDGWIVAEDREGHVYALTSPGKGEYFNEAVFVTSDSFLEHCSVTVTSATDLTGIAVISDGLEMVACDLGTWKPHAGFFSPLFAFVRDAQEPPSHKSLRLERFLASERINRKVYDDKTLLLAVRHPAGPSADSRAHGAEG